jgi:hypothetical protein
MGEQNSGIPEKIFYIDSRTRALCCAADLGQVIMIAPICVEVSTSGDNRTISADHVFAMD